MRRILIAVALLAGLGQPVAAETAAGAAFRDCPACPEMLVVPAGGFAMGAAPGEKGRRDSEGPRRDVTLRAFALGRFEVTFAEYDACVAAGGCRLRPRDFGWGRGRQPVVGVSWDDAQAYVAWLASVTGRAYRLPSEAEWEYAARAGTATRYWWGDAPGRGQANCVGCDSAWTRRTAPVGSLPANPFGLHEILGNVAEWVEDCWSASYVGAPDDGRPRRLGDCDKRVLRGGAWSGRPWDLRAARRHLLGREVRSDFCGFRVARDL